MQRTVLVVAVALALACGGLGSGSRPPAPPDAGDAAEAPAPARAASPPPAPRPVVPLVVGERWTWQVSRHTGAGLRVLFTAAEPARDEVVATWELSIDRALADDRFAATLTRTASGGLPARTDLVVWDQAGVWFMEGPSGPTPALALEVPPEPVATERVPCVAHVLDHLPGLCSPAPGGPLAVPPGPASLVVAGGGDAGRALAQVLVGVATAGLLIPGNRTATELAELTAFVTPSPATPSAVVEAFRASPSLSSLRDALAGPVNREEAAALVALVPPGDRVEAARHAMAALAEPDRASIARVVLSNEADGARRLPALAALGEALGPPTAPRSASILALLPEVDRPAGEALLKGGWPVLRAALVADDPVAALGPAAAAHPPSSDEALAVVRRSPDPRAALDALLPHVPPAGHLALLTAACAGLPFDDDRLALLAGREASFAAAERDTAGFGALFGAFVFDDGRRAAASLVLRAVSPAARPAVLGVAVAAMTFDDDRAALLREWPDVAPSPTGRRP